ncbi:hypothetical protein E2C01_008458 [Portunus trituberculatus]|uniref:Uncharacterized protein n=1 Tax=Portunus trituberculatus TaxID=210409 RepID=A0A5B7D1Y3_PORTR|nr:hypothetical protein [Portunus trituberculatus]
MVVLLGLCGETNERMIEAVKEFLERMIPHRVPVPQVMEGAWFAAQLLVHDRWKVHVQDHIVVDGQTQHDAHQCELCIILKAVWVEPEDLLHNQLEKLFTQASLINALLPLKLHHHLLLQVSRIVQCHHLQLQSNDDVMVCSEDILTLTLKGLESLDK